MEQLIAYIAPFVWFGQGCNAAVPRYWDLREAGTPATMALVKAIYYGAWHPVKVALDGVKLLLKTVMG